jgi:hypothetical protein
MGSTRRSQSLNQEIADRQGNVEQKEEDCEERYFFEERLILLRQRKIKHTTDV